MSTIQKGWDSEAAIQPAEIRLQEAAIAILIERISGLDKAIKEDLVKVMLDLDSCATPEDKQDVEQTIKELIFPELTGKLIVGSAGNATGDSQLLNWSKSIGDKIRELRTARNLTQEQLAETSGLLQSHISRLESGQHSPSNKTLQALANALGVSIKDIDPGVD